MASVHSQNFVVLLRVSTHSQGEDGLGIAAQRRDITLFLQQHPEATVLKELWRWNQVARNSVTDQCCRKH